jgi:hypothetical protein
MIKKTFTIIAVSFIISLILPFFQSCDWRYDATICDIDFISINQSFDSPDDLTEEIGFEIWSQTSCQSAFNLKNLSLFQSCYANTKCADWQNGLDISSYQLTLDRQIIFENDTLDSNTDLLKVENILSEIDITINEECKIVTSSIIFSRELKTKLDFEYGEYTVFFRCKTTDNREFEKELIVIFKE